MAIFVYADESGVFDKKHEEYFVFGGLIFLTKEERDSQVRRYRSAERSLGSGAGRTPKGEIKATTLSNRDKGKLFRSLNSAHKFSVVIHVPDLQDSIFEHKKTKQRYLDYAFKRAVKYALEEFMQSGMIPQDYDGAIEVLMDEHTTATDGRYELREALEQELRIGTHNWDYQTFFPPLLKKLKAVNFIMKDSRNDALIRGSDIVANRVYYLMKSGQQDKIRTKITTLFLP